MPERWAFKKDMPAFSPGVTAVLVEFRFECAYIAIDQENRVLMDGRGTDASWMPVFISELVGFGKIIGPQDMIAAKGTPMEETWRQMVAERRIEQFNS